MSTELAKLPAPAVRREEHMIQRAQIRVIEGHNYRFDFGDIESLGEQIYAQWQKDGVGVELPLLVKRSTEFAGTFELVRGERRVRAVDYAMKKYGIEFAKGLPCKLLDKKATEIEAKTADLRSNVSQKPLLPLEEAAAYADLRKLGLTPEKIAAEVGKSHHHVYTTLRLLDGSPELVQAVKEGTIGSALAKELAIQMKGDVEGQKAAVAEIRSAGKDKKARSAAVKKAKGAAREAQEKKAASKGKTLKIRALTDEQLNELGAKTSKSLAELLKDCGIADNDALLALCSSDNQLAAAFTLGALQALKAAAGMKINLKL